MKNKLIFIVSSYALLLPSLTATAEDMTKGKIDVGAFVGTLAESRPDLSTDATDDEFRGIWSTFLHFGQDTIVDFSFRATGIVELARPDHWQLLYEGLRLVLEKKGHIGLLAGYHFNNHWSDYQGFNANRSRYIWGGELGLWAPNNKTTLRYMLFDPVIRTLKHEVDALEVTCETPNYSRVSISFLMDQLGPLYLFIEGGRYAFQDSEIQWPMFSTLIKQDPIYFGVAELGAEIAETIRIGGRITKGSTPLDYGHRYLLTGHQILEDAEDAVAVSISFIR